MPTPSTASTASAAPTAPAAARFNPFSAAFRADPYPVYRELRRTSPVLRTMGMWVLTRHADVRAVLHDRTFSAGLIPRLVSRAAGGDALGSVAAGNSGRSGNAERMVQLAHTSLVFTDNPQHARLRALVNRVFTTAEVTRLRPRIAAIARGLLDRALSDCGGLDAVTDLAGPLPIAVLSEWMALPDDVRGEVGRWTHDVRFLLEPGLMAPGEVDRVGEVVATFADAMAGVIAARRARPGDDLVSRLLAARTGGGDRLTDTELGFLCIMCFVAGVETTTALIGNGLLALVHHPDTAALLHRRPELVAAAVEEALRYDSPLQLTKRLATRDVELGGSRIRAGEQVLLCLGAANRDPAVFDRPDTFDITRPAGGHLAFGHGMHGCLGGMLARAQAEIVFGCLTGRAERLAPAVDRHGDAGGRDLPRQEHSLIVRGLTSLPVALAGAW
ncbi:MULTISPECIES: cytochrome P450 [Frankia]|uniref:Cytochrome P450 like protein n=1 Tax=Frankia alni (strain DSM 45986 / CECT 9034 / ACN14a) TaxID=326424 RepID=Q0RK63_FRAAA|nr:MULTISPECIES: cytochrome P450 [Frankia]CAJ62096.1 Cytochrome P450 like protein [Frankia alni ACN14a]